MGKNMRYISIDDDYVANVFCTLEEVQIVFPDSSRELANLKLGEELAIDPYISVYAIL